MRLATLRTGETTRVAVRVGDAYALLDAGDVAELLRSSDWRQQAMAPRNGTVPRDQADFAPLVRTARKIICCGLNYADHIRETGREVPTFPTLFGKFNDTLAGAFDTIDLPLNSDRVDWEAELAVIVGAPLDHASEKDAAGAIAGYCIANDVSMRDWQQRTVQWMQGKVFTATTPIGPELVTPDEFDPTRPNAIACEVAGTVVQASTTDELVFSAPHLLSYISQFTALSPGDVVLTGTPGGVGMAATPPQYLEHGDLLVTRIAGLGELSNPIRDPRRT